jgi:hypothetical protein
MVEYVSLIAITLQKKIVIPVIAIVAVAIALSFLGEHVGVRVPRESGRHAHEHVRSADGR